MQPDDAFRRLEAARTGRLTDEQKNLLDSAAALVEKITLVHEASQHDGYGSTSGPTGTVKSSDNGLRFIRDPKLYGAYKRLLGQARRFSRMMDRVCEEANVEMAGGRVDRRRRLSKGEVAAIVAEREAGVSERTVAAKFGVNRGTVRHYAG